MRERLRIGLAFGGASVEHEVSVASARGVAAGFDPTRILCVPLAVTFEGRWLSPEVSEEILKGSARRVEVAPSRDDGVTLAVGPGAGLLATAADAGVRRIDVDAVFPVLHGWGGEDGRLQGALELAGIPCVGAGVLGSAVGMDKETTKRILESRGLPVVPWKVLRAAEIAADPRAAEEDLASALGFPMFVKPANGGSSVGISKVTRPGDLRGAIEAALECDRKVVAERGVDAREIECAVLGNDRPEASVPGEIVPSRDFYDYAAKYLDGRSELRIPAPLAPGVAEEVRRLAVEAFRALELYGMARVDFLLDRHAGTIYLNEANTLPGFTTISMYPKLWEASGVPYPELLERLVDLALERAEWQKGRAKRWEELIP